MNSQKLKNSHPEVYSKFFNEHEIIISLPLTIDRSIASYSNANPPCIKQKIPLRIYFGVRRQNKLTVDKILLYSHFEQRFYIQNETLIAQNNTISILNQAILEYCEKRNLNTSNYTIDILSEIGDNLDLGYHFNVFLGTIITIESFLNKELCSEFIQFSNEDINNVYYNSRIGLIFKDALVVYRKHFPTIPFASLITMFFNGALQFFSIRNNEAITIKTSIENRINFFGFSIGEVIKYSDLDFNKTNLFTQNFDLAVIHTGISVNQKSNFSISQGIQSLTYDQEMIGVLNKAISSAQKAKQDYFELKKINSINLLRDNLGLISLTISDLLLKLISTNYYPNLIDQLIYTINKLNKAFNIFYNSPQKYSLMIEELNYIINGDKESVGIFPFDMAEGGGCFSLISNTDQARKKINNAIENYKEKHSNSSICTIFESRNDGYEYNGIQIEQDVRNGIFSSFISKSNCIIQHYDGSVEFIDESSLGLNSIDDVVINTINNKIYVLGQKLTSKELLSQITTVEILSFLLSSSTNDIKSSEISASSYSKNKNDMISKIITPIKRIIESRCDKKLIITCTGSNNSYAIKLNQGTVKFGIIKKNI